LIAAEKRRRGFLKAKDRERLRVVIFTVMRSPLPPGSLKPNWSARRMLEDRSARNVVRLELPAFARGTRLSGGHDFFRNEACGRRGSSLGWKGAFTETSSLISSSPSAIISTSRFGASSASSFSASGIFSTVALPSPSGVPYGPHEDRDRSAAETFFRTYVHLKGEPLRRKLDEDFEETFKRRVRDPSR